VAMVCDQYAPATMKTKLLTILTALLTGITSGYAQQDTTAMRWKTEPYELGVPDRYDMDRTKGGTEWALYERDGWMIFILMKNGDGEGYATETAPAADFYQIVKYYHPNGMLKSRVKNMLGITFGKKEFFDERGNLIKVEDRDAQYEGVRIKREDVLEILEKIGLLNRQTGEHRFFGKLTRLKTDGSLYRNLDNKVRFRFKPAEMKNGKEVKPPMWYVNYRYIVEFTNTGYDNVLEINAQTGQYYLKEKMFDYYY